MAPKQSKNVGKFDLIIKELKAFGSRINECDDNKSRIRVLKTQVLQYETRLTEIFSELSTHERDESFDIYMKYKDILFNWVVDIEEKSQVEEVNSSIHVKSSVVNLPKLEVPHFYGNCENWISFKELFKSSILDNKSISDLEKLQYLQASVRGDAAKLIRGFAITVDNLKNCWDILCSRYENKRQLALSQINKLFSIKISRANTSKLLLEIIDICNEVIRNLKTLDLETNSLTELIIINFLISKVDACISQRWELSLENNKIPTLEEFRVFIEREARGLNELKFVKPDIKKGNVKSLNSFNKSNVNTTVVKCNQVKSGVKPDVVKGNNCILCYQSHAVFKCPTFNSMNVNERWQVVQNNNLCTNCLRSNHRLDSCRIGFSCKNCSERHHTLLHIYSVSPSADTQANSVVTVSNNCTQSAEGHVLLSTALINVKSKHGEQITCRALIENASQNSLISKQCADRLKLPLKHTNHKLVGVNETFAETSLYSTNFEFSSCVSSDKFQVKALLVSKVTSAMPNFPIKYHEWPHIKDLTLADPTFYTENEIDILLGADVFMTLISGTPIMGPKGTPSALPTKLGHLLSDGRYILKLPFRDDSSIGDSKEGALKRFYSLERKLHSNNQLKEQYTEFMEEYQNLGHMTPLASDVKSPHYFLPHHGVINDNSSTTKLRVVFDGSFKCTNGNSLNDILLTVTYGTSCAPFLAIRTLKQLCEDEKHRFPQAAKLAKDHFYVDDLLAGADSVDSARKIVHELQNLMSAGGFELRKWSCTHPEVLSDLPNTLKTNISSHSFDEESTQKILGLFWDLNEDSFKIILQDLWKAGLDWDDEISPDILNRWNRFQAEISCLKQIKVPRKSICATQGWENSRTNLKRILASHSGKTKPGRLGNKRPLPKQLLENSEWVAGPKWLHDFHSSSNYFIPFSEQPVSLVPIDHSESLSGSAVLSTGVDYSLSFLDKFSSYMKVVRTVAWIFRFFHNSKSVSKVTGPLYTHELETSIKKVVKLLQNGKYYTELTLLKCNKHLPKSSKLQSLNVFLDSEGILRVGGRLRLQQTLKFEQKHPMLIPKEHHFTSLVIRHFHRVNFHAGQELVLSLIRQKFWIPHGKSAVKKELHNCIDCFKLVAKPVSQMMGDLPIERINPCRAFEKVGIDFAGPIMTKCQHTRKANNFKSYICLFICMCTKAVQLELVSSLSAAAFLSALRRFVSRRGYPSDIYSDNGTNFAGASAYLKDLFQYFTL
ncbi:integrase catalytic domain-containing protein [Trichonephila clavipes]|nr:integrase catalytic domain-containing protein [Trichonephila clavipes]